MKRTLLAALCGASLTLNAPLRAQESKGAAEKTVQEETVDQESFEFQTEEEEANEAIEREFSEAFSIFGEIFKADPLTEEQEARLPMADKMSMVILPDGTFGEVMEETMRPMMTMMMNAITDDPRIELSKVSGVPLDDLNALDDDAAQSALDVFDPQFAARSERMTGIMTGLMGDMFEAMEPAYRQAMARAFTIRFSQDEMQQLLSFFETPLGGKFARESFLVQYDPQMLGVMEAMGPAMADIFPKIGEQIEALEKEYPPARRYSELSRSERQELSDLLELPEAELEALTPEPASNNDKVEEGAV